MKKKAKPEPSLKFLKKMERTFEGSLWNTRFIVLLAVIFGILSAIALFLTASYTVFEALKFGVTEFSKTHSFEIIEKKVLIGVIGSVDLYLIGVVVLIFSFGMYELFISKINQAHNDKDINILEIHSLDQLKNSITKVIIIVLVVSFFEGVLLMDFKTPQDMLYLAISIFVISLGLYFLQKSKEKGEH